MATAGERAAAAEVLAKAKARTARVSIVLDGTLLAEHDHLTGRLRSLPEDSDEAAAVAASILAVEDEMKESEVEFVFRGLGRGRWRKLVADYPPSAEDAARGAEFDPDEFPFVAMSECLVEPVLAVDDLKALHEEALSEFSFNELWSACLTCQIGSGSGRPESRAARAILESAGGRSQQR